MRKHSTSTAIVSDDGDLSARRTKRKRGGGGGKEEKEKEEEEKRGEEEKNGEKRENSGRKHGTMLYSLATSLGPVAKLRGKTERTAMERRKSR